VLPVMAVVLSDQGWLQILRASPIVLSESAFLDVVRGGALAGNGMLPHDR